MKALNPSLFERLLFLQLPKNFIYPLKPRSSIEGRQWFFLLDELSIYFEKAIFNQYSRCQGGGGFVEGRTKRRLDWGREK